MKARGSENADDMEAITIRGVDTSRAITSRAGKVTGYKFELGTGPISAMRKSLKETGLTNRQASVKIAEMLDGTGGNMAWAQAQTCMEVARSQGQFPTGFDIRKGSFCLRGSAAPVIKDAKQTKAVKVATEAVTNKAVAVLIKMTGCTEAEALAML